MQPLSLSHTRSKSSRAATPAGAARRSGAAAPVGPVGPPATSSGRAERHAQPARCGGGGGAATPADWSGQIRPPDRVTPTGPTDVTRGTGYLATGRSSVKERTARSGEGWRDAMLTRQRRFLFKFNPIPLHLPGALRCGVARRSRRRRPRARAHLSFPPAGPPRALRPPGAWTSDNDLTTDNALLLHFDSDSKRGAPHCRTCPHTNTDASQLCQHK